MSGKIDLAIVIAQALLALGTAIAESLGLSNAEVKAAIKKALDEDMPTDEAWSDYLAKLPASKR